MIPNWGVVKMPEGRAAIQRNVSRSSDTSILGGDRLDWVQPSQTDLIRPALSRCWTKWPLEIGPSWNYNSVILLLEAWVGIPSCSCIRLLHFWHLWECFQGETHLLAICDCRVFSCLLCLCFLACFFAVSEPCVQHFRPVWINWLLKSQPVLGPPAILCI